VVCGLRPIPDIDWCDIQMFCRYLSGKIEEGDAHNITCPGYDCDKLVPVELIETVVSRGMARRYLQFDIKVNLSFLWLINYTDSSNFNWLYY